jgi:hypothetical protein
MLCSRIVEAHVPYVEVRDYSPQRPLALGEVTQSKAIYAWLQSGGDVDVYSFEITGTTRLFAEALVPVCPEYATFRPAFAVVGPGLPAPSQPIPYVLPEGYGAIVVEPGAPESWPVFYEPFGGKSYYDGPNFDAELSTPGRWYLVYWDPAGVGGDYVASVGYTESFGAIDILRAVVITPIIRQNGELHTTCPETACCGGSLSGGTDTDTAEPRTPARAADERANPQRREAPSTAPRPSTRFPRSP